MSQRGMRVGVLLGDTKGLGRLDHYWERAGEGWWQSFCGEELSRRERVRPMEGMGPCKRCWERFQRKFPDASSPARWGLPNNATSRLELLMKS